MMSDSSIVRDYAIEASVPIDDIFIEEQSTITQENIFHAAQIANNNSIETVIIVSDPLHMKRAMLMAREVFFYIGYEIYRLF